MLLADTGAAPSMDYFGSGKYLIKTFDKRNNLSEIKRSVVKSNTKRHNLTNGYFLFARFIYNDYGLILNGTDRYGTNLRRNNFKQAGFTALRTVNRADIRNGYRTLLDIVLCKPVLFGNFIIITLFLSAEGLNLVLTGL